MIPKKDLIVIEHRINTIEQLGKVPPHRGVEIDIRDYDGDLRLVHNPFLSGEKLTDYLKYYNHKFIIFNVKCAGLENRILELAKKHNISNFFFLDLENSSIVKFARQGMRKVAVRFSDFEPPEFALAFAGKVDWIWVDCFEGLPLNKETYNALSKHFKICLVSPEMQKHPVGWVTEFRQQLSLMPIDGVCTDRPELWENYS